MEHHHITAEHLSVGRVREILERPVALSDDARARIVRCREYLDRKMENPERPIYGITTGFGSLCDISVGSDELSRLQQNLVMSHACGTGERVPSEIVRLILLLKIQSLAYGHSGVQLATVERLVEFFNRGILPVVYQQGSLGASGDLAPLAHMSLPLLGLGEVEYKGEVRPSAEELAELGLEPIRLQSKEGLALLNGTQFMSAYGVWSLIHARRLSEWADRIGALSLDAFDGRIEPFCDEVHLIRAHRGQLATARNVRGLLEGSELIARPKHHVQDPYSFRCMPQVHGASKDTIDYVESVLTTEINSTTDNPTVFPEEDMVVSAGNFHGLVFTHAEADDVRAGVLGDAGQDGVQPVVVVGKAAERCFQTAQNDGQVRVCLLGKSGVDGGAAVGPCAALAAGRILVLRAGDLCDGIVTHHAVHIAAADEEAVLRLAEPLEVLAVGVAGLGQHAHLVALGFQQAADDGSAEAGVVHIGVTAHHHKVQLVPAACFHVCPADGQKFGVDLWGRVVHNAPFVDSIPSQSTPYGVASSPEGGASFVFRSVSLL